MGVVLESCDEESILADLIIDSADNIINLLEIKLAAIELSTTPEYAFT